MGKQHILRSRKRQAGYKKVADGYLFYMDVLFSNSSVQPDYGCTISLHSGQGFAPLRTAEDGSSMGVGRRTCRFSKSGLAFALIKASGSTIILHPYHYPWILCYI